MNSEKSSGTGDMRELVAAVAGPVEWSDNRKSWLNRAARRAGISARQTKALFYGEIKDPNHRSARLMRDAAELAGRYEAIAGGLRAVDPDFYQPDVLALVDIARALRSLDRTRSDDEKPGTPQEPVRE